MDVILLIRTTPESIFDGFETKECILAKIGHERAKFRV